MRDRTTRAAKTDAVKEITVASYNVHRCIGTDRVHDPLRVVRVLKEIEADVIALQEVSSRREAGGVDQATYLAEAVDRCAIEGPTLLREQRSYGNVLLTRWPPLKVRRLDLSVPSREPRGAIDADIKIGSTTVRFIATHFGLRRAERRRQVQGLVDAIADHGDDVCVIAGDFNEWLPGSRCLHGIDRRFGASVRLRTFPSQRPTLALDRIWVLPPTALASVTVHATPLARVASDHLPIRARILLPEVEDPTA